MRANFTQLYLHCVWATWDRLPLITPEIEHPLHAAINRCSQELGCTVLAIGGVADHVHLLIHLPTTLSVSALIKNVKGNSSHLVTHKIAPNQFFKWQGSYAAFSVSHQNLKQVEQYIRNQATHHQQKKLIPDWEIPAPPTN